MGHVDHCSCTKPPGVWGEGGWHWRELDETLCAYLEIEAFKAATHREPNGEERAGCLQRAANKLPDYVGTPYGLERCPAWAARRALR